MISFQIFCFRLCSKFFAISVDTGARIGKHFFAISIDTGARIGKGGGVAHDLKEAQPKWVIWSSIRQRVTTSSQTRPAQKHFHIYSNVAKEGKNRETDRTTKTTA
ncbi:uncharacterized protein LOC110648064 [Hevea brasiliensis]|uniref:uncharacterized protein LOC110648064 n=1 Tax=Hevea brasiliensis TaxID=3981 RepID=UPI0025FE193F|nr:uncharacterized protein LOC110648064 [Hevea brasiliensis]